MNLKDLEYKEFSDGYYGVFEGTLLYVPALLKGSYDPEDICEVVCMENESVLQEINKEFGTSFKVTDFPGR